MSTACIVAFGLPAMPYVMWLFAIIGWLVFIVEAVVAAPVWAMMHCRMDGSDLVDQVQRPGYFVAFNLFLRPVMMLIALLLSYSVFAVSMYFMGKTFYPFVETMGANHTIGVFGLITLLGLITFLHYHVAMRSFSLVHMLPDRVSRWFGQQGESLGEQGDADKTTAMVGGIVDKGNNAIQTSMVRGKPPGASKIPSNPEPPKGGGGAPGR